MNKYNPTTKDRIQREVDLLPFGLCRVDILEAPGYKNPPMAGFAVENNIPIAQFYTKVIDENIRFLGKTIDNSGGVDKFIQKVVRHECRHYLQYRRMLELGIDYDFAIIVEDKFRYGEGPLEKDAVDYSTGIINDLDEICMKFYNEALQKKEEKHL